MAFVLSWLSTSKTNYFVDLVNVTVKSEIFENFILANSVKRYICHVKNSRLGHDLLT